MTAGRRTLAAPRRIAFVATVCILSCVPLIASAREDKRAGRPVNVVLMHGFTDTSAVFDPLIRVLQQHGDHTFAPSLTPKDFRYGVRDLTLKLSAEIDRHFGKHARFVMVGQSMGGLVVRDYVQNLRQGKRVRGFFMIATANRGTLLANLSPGGGVRDFAVGSPFLRQLNANVSTWKEIPVCAYWTPFDLVVIPSVNEKCWFGESKCILAPFHQSMARNPRLIADIAAKIDGMATRIVTRSEPEN